MNSVQAPSSGPGAPKIFSLNNSQEDLGIEDLDAMTPEASSRSSSRPRSKSPQANSSVFTTVKNIAQALFCKSPQEQVLANIDRFHSYTNKMNANFPFWTESPPRFYLAEHRDELADPDITFLPWFSKSSHLQYWKVVPENKVPIGQPSGIPPLFEELFSKMCQLAKKIFEDIEKIPQQNRPKLPALLFRVEACRKMGPPRPPLPLLEELTLLVR